MAFSYWLYTKKNNGTVGPRIFPELNTAKDAGRLLIHSKYDIWIERMGAPDHIPDPIPSIAWRYNHEVEDWVQTSCPVTH